MSSIPSICTLYTFSWVGLIGAGLSSDFLSWFLTFRSLQVTAMGLFFWRCVAVKVWCYMCSFWVRIQSKTKAREWYCNCVLMSIVLNVISLKPKVLQPLTHGFQQQPHSAGSFLLELSRLVDSGAQIFRLVSFSIIHFSYILLYLLLLSSSTISMEVTYFNFVLGYIFYCQI